MKTLILCSGHPPAADLFMQFFLWADYFIAADGGGNTARSFNRLPDVVIGDLDSFEREKNDSFEVIFDPDQEANDLEKALRLARQRKAAEVIVLGATGRRTDQTLKNISVLKQFNACFKRLIFKDDYGDLFLLPKTYHAELPIGTLVSLFPLSGIATGIRTGGLKFPLNDESLENGVRDGSSNEVIASPVHITYEQGDLIIFIGREE